MAIPDSHTPADSLPKQLRFGRYVLDLERGCLRFGNSEISLRPKTFALLRYLVENPGRLVSKDEFFAAVWPKLNVTDDTLVQSIGELRKALGDDGTRLIRTVPKRGYRFEPGVVDQPPTDTLRTLPLLLGVPLAGSTPAPATMRPSTGSHRGLLMVSAIGLLLAAIVVWIGVATDWKVLASFDGADKSAVRTGKSVAKPAVAILPFVNQNNDEARDYFADGLTQDLINALGRFPELTVMSWNAVFPYKGKPERPKEIARSLAVRYQVEGSVRQNDDRLGVIAQLVDSDGRVLWSDSFDESLANVFVLQDKVTARVAGALATQVGQIEQRRASAKPPDKLEAYDYVLRARPALRRPTRAGLAQARILLKKAIEIDPNYAVAYAALAETYYVSTSMGWAESPVTFLNRAEEMATKALSLRDTEVRAHVILGRIDIFRHQYEQAMAEMDHAIAINPNDAHGLAGRGNILMWRGQTDAAMAALQLAQRIDPELDAIDGFALSLTYYLKGRYGAAIEQAQLNLRKAEGANFNRVVLAAAYAQTDRAEDAARAAEKIWSTDPTFDPQGFGSKFLNPTDLERLRDGLRKAGLYGSEARPPLAADH
jgi:TolB-like protein/DNA-binding winged helix-turn-helix (wHTH) protein/cytochrome c-type biogenesis protein CcmH/NrfG